MAKNPTPFHNHPFRGKHIKNTKSSLKNRVDNKLIIIPENKYDFPVVVINIFFVTRYILT